MSQTIHRTPALAPRSQLHHPDVPVPPAIRPLSIGVVAPAGTLATALAPAARARGWLLAAIPLTVSPRLPKPLDAVLAELSGGPGDDEVVALARRAARARDAALIVCAPRGAHAERVRVLRAGVDGWIDAPCHPEEVIARVRALVRGGALPPPPPSADAIAAGGISIRRDRWQAYAGESDAGLTTREFELLELLARHGGEVLTRERIYAALWGGTRARGDRVVDVFVSRVRLKLERVSPGWRYIQTQSGVGYRFSPRRSEPLFAAASSSVGSA